MIRTIVQIADRIYYTTAHLYDAYPSVGLKYKNYFIQNSDEIVIGVFKTKNYTTPVRNSIKINTLPQ